MFQAIQRRLNAGWSCRDEQRNYYIEVSLQLAPDSLWRGIGRIVADDAPAHQIRRT
jgi:hypothetical protein